MCARYRIVGTWTLSVVLVLVLAGAGVAIPTARDEPALSALLQKADQARAQALAEALRIIKRDAAQQSGEFDSPMAVALLTLGRLHAVEAIPTLVEQIGYGTSGPLLEASPLAGRPAVQALVEIGLPAAQHVATVTGLRVTDEDTLVARALVVRCVMGDAALAAGLVDQCGRGQPSAVRQRFRELVQLGPWDLVFGQHPATQPAREDARQP